jgi:hypothetical protein
MKKAFPIALIIFGAVLLAGGGYTIARGFDAKDDIKAELLAQNITTPEDASIPNVRVDSAATARSMAEIIDHHARQSAGGKTYSEMGRFLAVNGAPEGTSNADEAVKGADGKPVANPLRNTAFQASALRTSLLTSVMAFGVADLVLGLGVLLLALGLAVAGVGVALAGLAIPAFSRRFHVEPVAANA